MRQLLLLVCLLRCCVSALEIIISEKGSDTQSCLEEHDPLVSCQSLVKVSEYVTSHKLNNVTIRINDTNYTLQGVANFSGVENVSITGRGHSLTHINCNSSCNHGAGIAFDNSFQITLTNFTISNCGATIFSNDELKNWTNLTGYGTAIQFVYCSQVSVSDIVVYRSISQGLTFINTGSTVQVTKSYFINNTVSRSHWFGGGALQILFFGTKVLNMSNNYTIANSTFLYNDVGKRIKSSSDIYKSYYCERGGGVRIAVFDNVLINSTIKLFNNTLEGNTAVFGGGILVCLSGNTTGNTINISHSKIIANKAIAGGGGFDAGYTMHNYHNPRENDIFIFNSSFEHNTALFGGGLSVFGGFISFFDEHTHNHINLSSCRFKSNAARGGAAVNIGPDILKYDGSQALMTIQFENCTIENNFIAFDSTHSGASGGNGAFFASVIAVKFLGTTIFKGNNGTALYLDSTIVMFNQHSIVDFSNNSGYQGGAILLFGKSAIYMDDSGHLRFWNNSATKSGGAICALTSEKHVLSYMNSCFLKVKSPRSKLNNITFSFQNNSATIGHDIYATSIASCDMLCRRRLAFNSLNHFFDEICYGNFNFGDSRDHIDITKHVATSPMNVTSVAVSSSSVMSIVPGILTRLGIVQYDEIGGNVSQLFPLTARVQSLTHNDSIKVDPSYSIITNNEIILFGSSGAEGDLVLESQSIRYIVRFKLSQCGPGFVLSKGKDKRCICSASSNNESLSYVSLRCQPSGLVGIAINYWAGYPNSSIASQDSLYTGVCVTQLCNPMDFLRGRCMILWGTLMCCILFSA